MHISSHSYINTEKDAANDIYDPPSPPFMVDPRDFSVLSLFPKLLISSLWAPTFLPCPPSFHVLLHFQGDGTFLKDRKFNDHIDRYGRSQLTTIYFDRLLAWLTFFHLLAFIFVLCLFSRDCIWAKCNKINVTLKKNRNWNRQSTSHRHRRGYN